MTPMNGLFAQLGTLRLWMLFFTLPYAWLWTHAAPAGEVHGTGGLLTVVVHSLLMLFYFACADVRQLRAGRMRRLTVWRNFEPPNTDALETARARLGVLIVFVCLVQLLVAPVVALVSLAVLALIAIMTLTGGERVHRLRYLSAEIIWPVALLLLPMALLADRGRRALASIEPGADPQLIESLSGTIIYDEAISATILGALLLCAFVLLCLIRDRAFDASERMVTMAVLLGRELAITAAFLALCVSLVIANVAVSYGSWGWHTPAVLAIGAMITAWLLAQRDEAGATSFLFMTHVAVGILLVASIG